MTSDQGPAFIGVAWVLTVVACVAYTTRIYSRTFLTRSLGSDDFMMAFSVILTIAGVIANTVQVHSGLGQHRETVPDKDFARDQLWETVAWMIVFISYFFIRASVMLFVLRLLPAYKLWQHRIIYLVFFVNLAITLIATVTYGIQCKPFKAIWDTSVQNAKCFSKDTVVTVTQVNGILACIVDIITALIPELLLWNVAMKPKTKRLLNIIFALGLITACTSIGRAATINSGALKVDTTWRLMPSKWFGMLEEKLGIVFACCPAIRQFYGYRTRVGTFKPTKHRQRGDEDFAKMRGRISWRDVFWYSQKQAIPKKTYRAEGSRDKKPEAEKHPAQAALQGVSKPEHQGRDVEAAFRNTADSSTQDRVLDNQAHTSLFTSWQKKFRGMFMASSGSSHDQSGNSMEMSQDSGERKTSMRRLLGKDTTNASSVNQSNHRYQPSSATQHSENRGLTESGAESERIGGRYRAWGLLPDREGVSGNGNDRSRPFLADDSADRSMARTRMEPEPHAADRPDRDYDLADMLAQPVARPAAVLRR